MSPVLAWILLAGAALQMFAQAPPVEEYRLKAAVLYNVAKFVEWPVGTFTKSDDPIAICIAGRNPFGSTLEDMTHGKKQGDRPFTVRLLSGGQPAGRCQILFISAAEGKRTRTVLETLKGAGILTVGETEDFTGADGVMAFRIEGTRVRIQVNLEAAERSGLHISSKLLSLAEIVKGK